MNLCDTKRAVMCINLKGNTEITLFCFLMIKNNKLFDINCVNKLQYYIKQYISFMLQTDVSENKISAINVYNSLI